MKNQPSALPTSLEKALRILFTFAPWNKPLRLATLSRTTGLATPTVHRLATALTGTGLLAFDPEESTYSLGLQVLDLAVALLESSPIRRVAQPHMAQLYGSGERDIVLTVPDGLDMVVLERLWSRHRPAPLARTSFWQVGARLPMLQAALGLAYAAWLDREEQESLARRWVGQLNQPEHERRSAVPWSPFTGKPFRQIIDDLRAARASGIAQQEGALEVEARAIASPLFGRGNRPVATVGVVSYDPALPLSELTKQVGPLLLSTARRISLLLGHR